MTKDPCARGICISAYDKKERRFCSGFPRTSLLRHVNGGKIEERFSMKNKAVKVFAFILMLLALASVLLAACARPGSGSSSNVGGSSTSGTSGGGQSGGGKGHKADSEGRDRSGRELRHSSGGHRTDR